MSDAVATSDFDRERAVYRLRKSFGDAPDSPAIEHYRNLPDEVLSETAEKSAGLSARLISGGVLTLGFGYAAAGSMLLDAKYTAAACAVVAGGALVSAARSYRAQENLKSQVLSLK